MDIRRIQRILPHRYPMLLIDRVLEIVGDEKVTGVKNVTFNDAFFQGHYPGTPIMPAVLIVEAMAQLSGILLDQKLEHKGKIPYLISMDKVKIRQAVVPGDQLLLEATTVRVKSRTAHVRCKAFVRDKQAAEADIKFMLVDAERHRRDAQCVMRGGPATDVTHDASRITHSSLPMPKISPLAFVDPKARLAEDVEVGPFCAIGPDVVIAGGTRLLSHVCIMGRTELGKDNVLYPGVVLGGAPQDRKYRGAPTRLVIGNGNLFREAVTIHVGSEKGGGSRAWAITTCSWSTATSGMMCSSAATAPSPIT